MELQNEKEILPCSYLYNCHDFCESFFWTCDPNKSIIVDRNENKTCWKKVCVCIAIAEMANDSQILLFRKDIVFFVYCGISNIYTGLTLFVEHACS